MKKRIPLTLTDRLAVDRTRLANERTFLAYLRTGLGGVGLAFLLVRFTDDVPSVAIGIATGVASVLLIAWGVIRFRKVRNRL